MPNTRKKVIKTVYIDEDDSEAEKAAGDFSDSGSDAQISEQSSSEDDGAPSETSSLDDFHETYKEKNTKAKTVRKKKFAKEFVNKINKQNSDGQNEEVDVTPTLFSVKDLTDADKLLPSVLNLSESDSSDDESAKKSTKSRNFLVPINLAQDDEDSDMEIKNEYKDVWSSNVQDNSDEVAIKTFMELEQHKSKIEETKASILNYLHKSDAIEGPDVNDLLAQGEEVKPQPTSVKKKGKIKKSKDDSDSEMEDWEEVKEAKMIPQQGLQLVVDIPDAVCRKTKKSDIEMMMKRKINRVKKEHQIYIHKVHVLCWIGHGNYVSSVLNDQEVLAAALSLVPSKECYPGQRVDMKYVEQITTWYKDKLTLKQDKNEDKFRPKAPPLKNMLLEQIKSRTVKTKKFLVFIFISMLRSLGLQCRIMFNFVTLPIKPPASELCSLSTKPKDDKIESNEHKSCNKTKSEIKKTNNKKSNKKIPQIDGNDDNDIEFENIKQLDGNDDTTPVKMKSNRSLKSTRAVSNNMADDNEDVSPPKRSKKSVNSKPVAVVSKETKTETLKTVPQQNINVVGKSKIRLESEASGDNKTKNSDKCLKKHSVLENNKTDAKPETLEKSLTQSLSPRKTRRGTNITNNMSDKLTTSKSQKRKIDSKNVLNVSTPPKIVVTNEDEQINKSLYFDSDTKCKEIKSLRLSRKRSHTVNPSTSQTVTQASEKKCRTKSAPGNSVKSKYFNSTENQAKTSNILKQPKKVPKQIKTHENLKDEKRISHRDLMSKSKNKQNDVTNDLVNIIKNRIKEAKSDARKGIVKGKAKKESDEDSDYLSEEVIKHRDYESDEDFKPTKISPKPSTSRKIDRRVLSSDDEMPRNKTDVWCEVFVEELEQWIAVDVILGKVHCDGDIYKRATHPVCYVVGWDNNNYLKDVTRRYVPHWNTVTRKQRVEPAWWEDAVRPWRGPSTARDKEEDEQLNRMQLEAPLPKSIAEYKNHPLYALKRHLLKFEAIYPPDAATLGFVRNEPVYARECVHVCRSRDTWLKEAKVVRLGEKPYKVVKARPKWDKLSNKLITDKPLEVFGPWQVQDYEPPVAENGIVPRNAYGNVELFKECMLPKGTVHIKLPGLNRVAKKLNIDCAPAMTGFDFNGGWSHPVYDGFVVCEEFGEIITDAWLKDQEEQERKEREKIETRVYGNWKRLIKGLFIRERLKNKYGFQEPSAAPDKKKAKAPRLVVKKKS